MLYTSLNGPRGAAVRCVLFSPMTIVQPVQGSLVTHVRSKFAVGFNSCCWVPWNSVGCMHARGHCPMSRLQQTHSCLGHSSQGPPHVNALSLIVALAAWCSCIACRWPVVVGRCCSLSVPDGSPVASHVSCCLGSGCCSRLVPGCWPALVG